MEIQFLGAADCVTGSRHLVTSGPHRVLLDCGLFQGWKMLRERNWSALAVPPHEIDAAYLDSPMAQEATAIYTAHRDLLRLSKSEARGFSEGIKPVHKPQDSARLARLRGPAVILASSGMATGGRVLGHLAALAPDPRNAIVFPGFQVPGSRGGKLVRGATEIKVMGQYVAVKAQVHHLEGMSGHADADGLIAWMRQMPTAPKQVMVVHGEPEASDALRIRIEEQLGWPARVPQAGERLGLGTLAALRGASRR